MTLFRAGLLAAMVSACSAGPLTTPQLVNNRCVVNTDCTDSVCDGLLHVCVATQARSELVFVAVPPTSSNGLDVAATALEPRSVGTESNLVDIPLVRPVLVAGVVRMQASATAGGGTRLINARVRFHRRDGAVAQPDVVVQASDQFGSIPGRDFSFSVQLVPGVYDITVTPSDPDTAALAPPYFDLGARDEGVVIPALPAGGVFPVEYVFAAGARELTGFVADAVGPLRGMQVRAVSRSAAREVISTEAATDESGRFRILLSSGWPAFGDGSYDLEVYAAVDRPERFQAQQYSTASSFTSRMVYRFRRDPMAATSVDPRFTLPGRVGLVPAGSVATCESCVVFQQRIEGTLANGATVPVAGARVVFHGTLDVAPWRAGEVWVEGSATADARGEFEVTVPPGNYQFTVTPPADASEPLAVTRFEGLVGGALGQVAQRGGLWLVDRRTELAGAVVGVAGAMGPTRQAPMAQVEIHAVPLSADARETTSHSGTDGSFRLLLDPGRYRLVARPPEGRGFATAIYGDVVEVATRQGSAALADNIRLESPFPVSGRVLDTVGGPVADSAVHVYARLHADGGGPMDIEVGQATTDARGSYRLLVPSGLP